MDWRAACAAVIPCLNEQAAIGPLVEAVQTEVATVFVIDDGSADETSLRAKASGGNVLRHTITMGKGVSLQNGLSRAHDLGFVWALVMDGDGQHSPLDIPRFFERAQSSGASLLVGNRMAQASRIPPLRRWVNRWMSWQLSRMTGRRLPDSQCGFRLVNLQHWARLAISATHFEIESEVLVRFAQAGLAIEFVPIRTIYKTEQSKIHPWRDTVRWFIWWRWTRRELKRANSSVRLSVKKSK